ncbi:MAG: repeat-like protein [Gemmataceae bacterium]|nr:repeat-like protein [Gemmataceae bacterium]
MNLASSGRRLSATALLVCLCDVAWSALAVPAIGGPEAAGDATDVTLVRTVDRQPGAARLWQPYIAQWGPRDLVVAFGAGIPGKTDMGDILSCVSTDEGKTWGEPVAIFDHRHRHGALQFAYANPVLYRPPGQDVLWCFAMRCPVSWTHSEDAQLAAAYSGDGGRSWVPVELTMHYSGPVIIVGGILRVQTDRGPRYLLPVHRNTLRNDPRGSRDQFVLESTSLLEWRLPGAPKEKAAAAGFIPQPAEEPVFLHEGQLAPGDKEGEVRMVMRTARYDREQVALDPPRAYSSLSRDGGRTWSAAAPEPDLHNTASKAFFGRTTDGTDVYVYNDGKARERLALRYKVRPPGGSWSPERTFFDAGVHNSYPTLLEYAPSRFYVVWDSGTEKTHRTGIRFGKLTVR